MDYSSPRPDPGSSVHGIFQARILKGVVISFSRGSFWPRDWIHVFYISCIGRQILYHCVTCVAHIRGKTSISFNKANITLYVARETQIKMTMRYHYATTKKAKIQNIGNTKYWWGCRETVTLFIARGMHNGIATLEDRQLSYKSKETHTTEQLSSLIFIQWNWKLMSIQGLHVSAYYIIVYSWKKSWCYSVGGWINKLWYLRQWNIIQH